MFAVHGITMSAAATAFAAPGSAAPLPIDMTASFAPLAYAVFGLLLAAASAVFVAALRADRQHRLRGRRTTCEPAPAAQASRLESCLAA